MIKSLAIYGIVMVLLTACQAVEVPVDAWARGCGAPETVDTDDGAAPTETLHLTETPTDPTSSPGTSSPTPTLMPTPTLAPTPTPTLAPTPTPTPAPTPTPTPSPTPEPTPTPCQVACASHNAVIGGGCTCSLTDLTGTLSPASGQTSFKVGVFPGLYTGVALTLSGEGVVLEGLEGPEGTDLQGAGDAPVLRLDGCVGCTVERLTLSSMGGNVQFGRCSSKQATLLTGPAIANGGAVSTEGGSTVTLSNMWIVGHAVNGSGGALYLEAGANVTLTHSVLCGNSASYGGAVAVTANAALDIANTWFVGNEASGSGGAVWMGGKSGVTASYVMFKQNGSPLGAALYLGDQAQASLSQTILIPSSPGTGTEVDLFGSAALSLSTSILTTSALACPTTSSILLVNTLLPSVATPCTLKGEPTTFTSSDSLFVENDFWYHLTDDSVANLALDVAAGLYGGDGRTLWDLDGDGAPLWYWEGSYETESHDGYEETEDMPVCAVGSGRSNLTAPNK